MTKAILANTATDEFGGQDGAGSTNAHLPTQTQGWGRVNLRNIVDGTAREFVDQNARLGATGQRDRRVYAVADATKPLKVTLAWTDVPGPTAQDEHGAGRLERGRRHGRAPRAPVWRRRRRGVGAGRGDGGRRRGVGGGRGVVAAARTGDERERQRGGGGEA